MLITDIWYLGVLFPYKQKEKKEEEKKVLWKTSWFSFAEKEKQKESCKDKKYTNGEAASLSDELKKPLVWIDLEMTG